MRSGTGARRQGALLHGFKRGENAIVPEGKRFDAAVSGAATVNVTTVSAGFKGSAVVQRGEDGGRGAAAWGSAGLTPQAPK